jgi:hypothetical protein
MPRTLHWSRTTTQGAKKRVDKLRFEPAPREAK